MATQVFTTPGYTTFTVPGGVSYISVKAWAAGAGGGAGGTVGVGGNGGGGGYVGGGIPVVPGEELTVHVGGLGSGGSFPGTSGSGGGGAGQSMVFRRKTEILFLAGAGGGGGGGDNSSATAGGVGGVGGGSTGGTGGNSSASIGATGGTQSAGGAGGTGGANVGSPGGDPNIFDYGNCLEFGGTNEYITTANSYTSPQNFTLDFWFKTTTTTGGMLMGWGDTQTEPGTSWDRRVYMQNNGQVRFGVHTGIITGIQSIVSPSTYNDGFWHHCAVTHSSSPAGIALFMNGVSVASSASVSIDTYTGYWRVGGATNWTLWPSIPTSGYFIGQMDEIRYWTAVRTIQEIRNFLGKYLVGTETNLGFYWKLNESTGSTANDETSNNNDGTLRNMENSDWVDSDWEFPFVGSGSGGYGADGTTATSKGGQANGGVTNGGRGGTGDLIAGYAGGAGGGGGYYGGGGGACSAATDAGGSGGGGGSNYVAGFVVGPVSSQATGTTPPNTGDSNYAASAGVGGNGGALSTVGAAGNNGRIVLIFELPIYGGLEFVSGSSQYLSTVSNYTPTDDISVAFWLYNRNASQTGRIISLSDAWEIYLQANGTLGNDLNWAVTTLSSIGTFQSETFYHVVCTRASNNARQIYINGVLDNSDSGGTAATPSAAILYIGVKQNLTNYLTGLVEDLRIYHRVISAPEVATIFACRGTDSIVYELHHRWKINEGPYGVVASGAGIIKDEGTESINATPQNSPVFRGTTLKYKRFG